jgi:hypothetical protein
MFINFKQFNESIKLSQAKKYTQIWKDANMESYMAKEFDNKYRIYLPVDGSSVNIEPDETIKLELVNFFYDIGYRIESYNANLCKKVGTDKNFTKITKILQKFGKTELLIAYNKDHEQLTKVSDGYFVVISRHPVDIAGMTAGRRWLSCMNIDSGSNKQYVEADIREGSIIAYLIKNDDKNIQNPLSRILIKPYIYEKTGKTYLIPGSTYGTISEKFEETINNWLISVQGALPTGRFNLNRYLYADGQVTAKYNVEEKIKNLLQNFCKKLISIEYDEVLKTVELECESFKLNKNIENFTITSLVAEDVEIDCKFLKDSDFTKNAIQTDSISFQNFNNDDNIIKNLMSWSDIILFYVNISSENIITNLQFLENCQISELSIGAAVKGIESVLSTIQFKDLSISATTSSNDLTSAFINFKPKSSFNSILIQSINKIVLDLSNLYFDTNSGKVEIYYCRDLQLLNSQRKTDILQSLLVVDSNVTNNSAEFERSFINTRRFIDKPRFRDCTLNGQKYDFAILFD